jgi:hypothetical protein
VSEKACFRVAELGHVHFGHLVKGRRALGWKGMGARADEVSVE